MQLPRVRIVLLAVASLLVAWPAVAQVVVVPRFAVGPSISGNFNSLEVAPMTDGGMVFLWSEDDRFSNRGYAYTRRYSNEGTPIGPVVRVDQGGHVRRASLSSDGRGGFTLGYWDGIFPYSLWGRYLDGTGAGLGSEFQADCDPTVSVGPLPSFAGLASGMVAIYERGSLRGCVLDAFGVPRTTLDVGDGGHVSAVAALPDGGFVVTWIDGDAGASFARLYDADGVARGIEYGITPGAGVQRVAANPLGGFAVASLRYDAGIRAAEVQVERFDAAGVSLGAPIVVKPMEPGIFAEPDLAFDLGGDVYIAWGEYRDDGVFEYRPARGRVIDPNGNLLGPAFAITDTPTAGVRTTRLANGALVNLWLDLSSQTAAADVLSLCTPGVAVCGDGTVVPQCEQCDDGSANSDSAPDACRTDCERPRCGDGVVDGGESCDDGNRASCDGCSRDCGLENGLVCGDGSVAPDGCGELCDDGNAIEGDGCSATCQLERIPGRGSPRTDCFSEWVMDNPSNVPFRDTRGDINVQQQCIDGDARCDFDGGIQASCTFHVRVCANNTELPSCPAPVRLAAWELTQPSLKRAATSAPLAAVRDAFAPLAGTVVGPSARDLCSDVIPVTVPLKVSANHRAAGKLVLKAAARSYSGERDKDILKLTCLPPP